jgi:uncharacterized protein (TIGR03663 family)
VQQAASFLKKTRQFFTFERIFIIILIAAFILRFIVLDLKLLHHDEAIHSWFSYELLTKGAWKYDPSYHGPFLYYVTAGMFSLFGDSDLTARLLPSLCGFLLIPLVWFIYRLGYLDKRQALLAAAFIAFSPDMVYFSRFLRHDIFMLFFTFLLVVALFYYIDHGQRRYVLIAAIATAGALSCKEEMPFIILVIFAFFAFEIWQRRLPLPAGWKTDIIIFLVLTTAIMSVLYSGFGGHIDTLQHGWLDAIEHWTEMHNKQRLGGPWYFYIPLFLLYELPIFLLAIVGTLQFIFKDTRIIRSIKQGFARIPRRHSGLPVDALASSCLEQIRRSKDAIQKPEEFFRFCIFWMLMTMAFYAYVGEKVPWLIIHPLLPMCFVAVYRLNWQKTLFAVAGIIFLLMMTWHVAFVPADINEPIIQVQNSEEMREVMGLMDASGHVVIASKNYWPLPWYYRGDRWNKITFFGDITDISTLTQNRPGMIILHDAASYPSIEGYDKKTYKLSYWFSFFDNSNRLLEYYFHRDGKMGSMNLDVFTIQKAV